MWKQTETTRRRTADCVLAAATAGWRPPSPVFAETQRQQGSRRTSWKRESQQWPDGGRARELEEATRSQRPGGLVRGTLGFLCLV